MEDDWRWRVDNVFIAEIDSSMEYMYMNLMEFE